MCVCVGGGGGGSHSDCVLFLLTQRHDSRTRGMEPDEYLNYVQCRQVSFGESFQRSLDILFPMYVVQWNLSL